MTWQFNSYALILLLAALAASVIFIYTFQHQRVKGTTYFLFLLGSVIVWSFFLALEYAVVEIDSKIWFAKFQYFGISTIGSTWYLFAVNYGRKEKRFGKSQLYLLVIPIFAILLVFTNESHGLIWSQITPASSQPGANLVYSHGPAFWILFAYIYILLLLGTFVIIRTALSSKEIYRAQTIGLIVSALIPWIGNFIYVSGLSPVPGLDLTPLGFTVSGFIIAWSIFSLRLFDLAPVARDQLVENLVDGVIVLDTHNRVVEINLKARQLLNLADKGTLGYDVADFMQSWPALLEQFRDVQAIQTEVHIGTRDVNDVDVRISPLMDERHQPAGRIITIRDISEQKKQERMRENMTRSIVNDLRNPLTSVALGLETLRRQGITILPKAQLETLDVSQQSLQQMLDLVDSILDIYRLEKGEMPLNLKRVSLSTLASEATRSIAALANKKRILIQLDISEGMPAVLIDPNLMRRVFQNLLDSSVKTLADGRVIRIQAGFERSENAVVVSIIDMGGEDTIRNYQFEKSIPNQDNFDGSGLGLAFCRLAVEAHGGHIWVDERYRGGTKISLTIPERG